MNINESPEGVPARQWYAGGVVEPFANNMALLSGSSGAMYVSLYKLWEIYSSLNVIPSVIDYYEYLEDEEHKLNKYSVEMQYSQRRKSRVETFIYATGEMSYCSSGWRPEELTGQPIVWEMDGVLDTSVQRFLIEHIITRVYLYRMMNPEKKHMPLVLVIEEGHKLFDRHRWMRVAQELPPIGVIIDTMRALNMWLIVSSPSVTQVAPHILKNCGNKVMFKMGDAEDVYAIGRSEGMTPEQFLAATHINPRECIVSTPSYPLPFPVRVNEITVPHHQVTNEEIKILMKHIYESIPIKPRFEYALLSRNIMSSDEEAFLKNVIEEPILSVVERYFKLHYAMDTGNRIKKGLINRGYLRQIELPLGRKGRPKLLEITAEGKEYLEKRDTMYRITERVV